MSEASNQSKWVVDTTDATFQQDVFERSKERPVVVDFWASWCQPCRALGPILQRLAEEYDGKFVLVKADTDHNMQAAQTFSVQGIPAVFGVRGGEVVDFFEGLLPEDQIREWLDRLQPSEAERLLAEAESLRQSDPDAAEAKYRAAIEADARNVQLKIALAKFLMDQKKLEQCQAMLRELADAGYESDVEQLLSAVEVQLAGEQVGSVEECRAAAEAEPDNLQLQLKLAEALVADGQYQQALQICLDVVKTDKTNFGEPSRQIMVGIFNLLPPDSELIREYRRKLSSALF